MPETARSSIVWPSLLDLTPTECQRKLRNFELRAYSSLISVFRAQGLLSGEKRTILSQVRQLLRISLDTHRAEIRRAINDEELSTICESTTGSEIAEDWINEGKRIAPILDKALPFTDEIQLSTEVSAKYRSKNRTLPHPAEACDFRSYEKALIIRPESLKKLIVEIKTLQKKVEKPKQNNESLAHAETKKSFAEVAPIIQNEVVKPSRKREFSESSPSIHEETQFKIPVFPDSKCLVSQNGQFRKPNPSEILLKSSMISPKRTDSNINKVTTAESENFEPLAKQSEKLIEIDIGTKIKQLPSVPSLSHLKKQTDSSSIISRNNYRQANTVAKVFMRSPMLNSSASGFTKTNYTSSSPQPPQNVSYVSSVSQPPSTNTSVINRFTSTVPLQSSTVPLNVDTASNAHTITPSPKIAVTNQKNLPSPGNGKVAKEIPQNLQRTPSTQPKITSVPKIIHHPQSCSNLYYVHKTQNSTIIKPLNGQTSSESNLKSLIQEKSPDVCNETQPSRPIQILNTRSLTPTKPAQNNNNNSVSWTRATTLDQGKNSISVRTVVNSSDQQYTIRPAPLISHRIQTSTINSGAASSTDGPNANRNGSSKSRNSNLETIPVQLPHFFNNQTIEVPIVNSNVDMDDPEWDQMEETHFDYHRFFIEGQSTTLPQPGVMQDSNEIHLRQNSLDAN